MSASIRRPETKKNRSDGDSGIHILRTVGMVLAVVLLIMPDVFAQTAADHAALAHGKPIVNGHNVQPTPAVVQERQRHYEMMRQSERNEWGRTSSPSSSESPQPPTNGVTPNGQSE